MSIDPIGKVTQNDHQDTKIKSRRSRRAFWRVIKDIAAFAAAICGIIAFFNGLPLLHKVQNSVANIQKQTNLPAITNPQTGEKLTGVVQFSGTTPFPGKNHYLEIVSEADPTLQYVVPVSVTPTHWYKNYIPPSAGDYLILVFATNAKIPEGAIKDMPEDASCSTAIQINVVKQ